MSSYNKIIVMGNLTQDPMARDFEGKSVTTLSLAVNEKYTNRKGEKVEEVEYFYVTFWGKTAEVASKYLKKGDKALIEGKLKTDIWQDKEGKNRFSLKVAGEKLVLMGGSGHGKKQEPQSQSSRDDMPF